MKKKINKSKRNKKKDAIFRRWVREGKILFREFWNELKF